MAEICYLSNDIYDYYNVSQGKITIPNMDDGEELQLTDVSRLESPKFDLSGQCVLSELNHSCLYILCERSRNILSKTTPCIYDCDNECLSFVTS